MKRRDFFRLSAPLLSSPFFLNNTAVSTFNSLNLFTSLDCDTVRERFLVIVQLKGANDGLNTIMRPEYESDYVDKRNSVRILPGDQLQSSESAYNAIRFHPKMAKIRDLCDLGAVNIIESVGYPSMNRSHFKATDLWLTGSDGINEQEYGWMGKYLEAIYEGYNGTPSAFMPDPLGIHLRGKNQSLGFHSESEHLAAINLSSKDPSGYYTVLQESSIGNTYFNDPLACTNHVDFMKLLDQEAQVYGQRISEVFARGTNSNVDYGTYDLGAQLRTVARLVSGGCKTKIFLTELGGFDTHVDQLGRHEDLLEHLSVSVNNFMTDLDAMSMLDKCLVMTFSEFGRKFTENAGGGTDHGTLAPIFVMGHPDKVNAGLSGPHIDVTDLDPQGAPSVLTGNHKDYRDVFSSVLKQWLGAEDPIIDDTFEVYTGGDSLSLINNTNSAVGTAGCYEPNQTDTDPCVDIEVPIIGDEYESGGLAGPGITGSEPLQEITACNYVDLKPGFVAECGTNVIIYPSSCVPSNGALAVFKPQVEAFISDEEEVITTRVEEAKKEVRIVERTAKGERIKINLFPNPAQDFINVKFSIRQEERKIRIEVLDNTGATVPVILPQVRNYPGEYELRINVSNLIPGTYYVRYVSHKAMETMKFVKL